MQVSLKRNDFIFLKKSGGRYKGRHFIVLYDKSLDHFSWSGVASKKMGNAVARNYYKRTTREIIRSVERSHFFLSCRLMIICLKRKSFNFEERQKDLIYILNKIGVIKKI